MRGCGEELAETGRKQTLVLRTHLIPVLTDGTCCHYFWVHLPKLLFEEGGQSLGQRGHHFRPEGLLDLFVESLSVTPADNSWNTILPVLTYFALLISFGLYSSTVTGT